MSRIRILLEEVKGGFSAFSPDLPGCVATGRTKAEAGRRMRAAIRMHLEGLKEDRTKKLRCGKCGTGMRKRPETGMGLKVTVHECPRCGKRLIGFGDAVCLQKRALSRIGKRDADMMAGGLKCVCGKTAKRVNDLEYDGMVFGGWRCKCGETLADPYQANLFLKARKMGRAGAAGAERPPPAGRKGAGLRLRAIQKALGAEAARKGITKKDLLRTLERIRKSKWHD